MTDRGELALHQRWALFRFSVVGPLLAAPPRRGEVEAQLQQLADKVWRHPVTGAPARFGLSTLERWYYEAKAAGGDPVGALRKRVRKDAGQQPAMPQTLRQALAAQHAAHSHWSCQLHYDNLRVLVERDSSLGPLPSYATVRRYMKTAGLTQRSRVRARDTAGARQAQARLESREVRSYEVEYVNGLWHLDFHIGSLPVLTPEGQWVKPHLLGIVDDSSRLACHLQWYLGESAENLVHGLSQAFAKRGLPRALMSDRGAAEQAEEVKQGLGVLGIVHESTLPYSPYQNGKQESFWGQVEGRLLAMLQGREDLTLAELNEATQAWGEMEYNRKPHSELGASPLERWVEGKEVSRPCPGSEDLRQAFTRQQGRAQRRSDGTISLEGRRLEVPSRYRHLERVTVRYAQWDLSRVYMVDERAGQVLCRLYPQDKARNAQGQRRAHELQGESAQSAPAAQPPATVPLLEKLLADYAATGLPPAYLPKDERRNRHEEQTP